MKKTIFVFSFLLLFISAGFPLSDSDSLRALLLRSSGKKRIDILNALSGELKYKNTSEAYSTAAEALTLSEKYRYKKGKAVAFKNLATLNILTNNNKEAIRYANQGIIYATSVQDTFTLAKLYNIKALVLENQSSYSQAISYFLKSHQLFRQIGNTTETTGILNNLAALYGEINEKRLQLDTYLKVIDLEEEAGNKSGLARTYCNIADIYQEMGYQVKAMELYRKSLQYSRQLSSLAYESAALNGIALILKSIKRYDSAVFYLEQAANINRRNQYQQNLANNYLNLGSIYIDNIGNIDKGRKYLEAASSIFRSIDDWDNYMSTQFLLFENYQLHRDQDKSRRTLELIDDGITRISNNVIKQKYYQLKYEFAKKQGNVVQALRFLELTTSVTDSINAFQQLQQTYELQARYDLTHQQQENEKLRIQANLKEETIQHQRWTIMAIVVTSVLLVMIVILTVYSMRKIKKANASLNEFSRQLKSKAIELEKTNETKDKFLSIISHDLKNPLNAIIGLSDLLLDPDMQLTEKEKLRYVKYINEGCLSADQLLENLMKWARSQQGKLEMVPAEFDLVNSVSEAISLVSNAALRKNIKIKSEVEENTWIFADREMINTCVINLLSNAVKFTPDEGLITIRPEVNCEMLRLNITDTGVGMSDESLRNLFRMDTKSGTLGTANEKGTGLGLLLVKEFIEKNNGSIEVRSTKGVGSTFTLKIPLVKKTENVTSDFLA